MEIALKEIIGAIRTGDTALDDAWLDRLVRARNRATHDGTRRVAKKRLLPYYLALKQNDPARLAAWGVDEAIDEQLVRLLRAKPRRTASGVATITVLTKPWPCSSNCLYCPSDVRMPKSYLTDEPACQRAERNFFDPYLQVTARLRTLEQMGHVTDKVELIVLGGTWSDYPQEYQLWFVAELFRALNEAGAEGVGMEDGGAEGVGMEDGGAEGVGVEDAGTENSENPGVAGASANEREAFYLSCGLTYDRDELAAQTSDLQRAVTAGERTYNHVAREHYRTGAWAHVEDIQHATLEQLEREQRVNERAAHRVVGLVIETRPDLVTPESLTLMRRMGCTKVQMGIQSLNPEILEANERNTTITQVRRAFALLRLFGFKIHVHFMANLLGATPEADKADYLQLVTQPDYLPDEVKLYPCCLVESSRLGARFATGAWTPYAEDDLVDVLMADVLATPPYTRISRMIRDISAGDIVAGNKKTNLRQLVEARLDALPQDDPENRVREIRHREISTFEVDPDALALDCVRYETSVSQERFLQWVTPEGRIAGFLRLSLPHPEGAGLSRDDARQLPVDGSQAMIREVHVYGKVARLQRTGGGVQHKGLGRRLVEEACAQARDAGYASINVISSVGTRDYYRALGFEDDVLYQRRAL